MEQGISIPSIATLTGFISGWFSDGSGRQGEGKDETAHRVMKFGGLNLRKKKSKLNALADQLGKCNETETPRPEKAMRGGQRRVSKEYKYEFQQEFRHLCANVSLWVRVISKVRRNYKARLFTMRLETYQTTTPRLTAPLSNAISPYVDFIGRIRQLFCVE